MTEKQNWVWVLMRRYHHRGYCLLVVVRFTNLCKKLTDIGHSLDTGPDKISD